MAQMVYEIEKLEDLGTVCPTQWEGKTTGKEYIYIRYRYGELSVHVEGGWVFGTFYGSGLDGVLSYRKLKELLPWWIKLPE